MKILAVDTTSTTFTAVLIDDAKTLATSFEVGKSGHSSLILPTINELMDMGDIKPADLDCVAVVVGPGSFTGLRIGLATVKGLCHALKKPCYPVSTIDALYENIKGVYLR